MRTNRISLWRSAVEANGQGAVEFLLWAPSKGLLNANTAGSLRAALKEVLSSVEGDDWGAVDLRNIDVEDYGQRFERLRLGNYKPESLAVYRARFKNARVMFLEYLDNPSGWRYRPERPASARSKPDKSPANGIKRAAIKTANSGSEDMPPVGSIEYPYPLRPELVVRLWLPADLSQQEAKRLGGFIDALAIVPVPRLAAPQSQAS
jgi:hypothetical protein